MKKNIIALIIMVAMLTSAVLTGCGSDADTSTSETVATAVTLTEETDICVVFAGSSDRYVEVLQEIAENDFYLIDVSYRYMTGYVITYSEIPIFSQCPHCDATLDQVK